MKYKQGDTVYCKKNFLFLDNIIFEEGKSYIIDNDHPSFYSLSGVSFYKKNNTVLINEKYNYIIKLDNYFHDYFCTLKELRQIKIKKIKKHTIKLFY